MGEAGGVLVRAVVKLQLLVDRPVANPAGPKPEAPQKGASTSVLPQRRGREHGEAVRSGPIHNAPRELRADAPALQVVGDLDGHVRDSRSIGVVRVSGDPHDRSVAYIDRDDRLVADVINVDCASELARRQCTFWYEVSQAARFWREPAKQRGKAVAIMSVDRPEVKPRAAYKDERVGRRGGGS